MLVRRVMSWAALLLALAVAGCDGDSSINRAPLANAGADLAATTGSVVSLDGAASLDADGDPLTYAWVITSKPVGSATTLLDSRAPNPRFIADLAGNYVVSLVVNDGRVDSTPATVSVSVTLSAQAQADLAQATAARLRSVINASTGEFKLEWQDSFPAATGYRVEVQTADGSFTAVETVARIGSNRVALSSSSLAKSTANHRVLALVDARSVVLLTPTGLSTLAGAVSEEAPTILLNKTAPIQGKVQLSVGGSQAYAAARWYLDGLLLGDGSNLPGRPLEWDTSIETGGDHRLLARIELTSDVSMDVERVVTLSNDNAVSSTLFGTTGTIYVSAYSAPASGIASVSATVDGLAIGSLTEPNKCYSSCYGYIPNVYGFEFDAITLESGPHIVVLTVTYKAGNRVRRILTAAVSNPPVISLVSPADGALTSGPLVVRGSTSSDKRGPVTVNVTLDGRQVLESTSTNFAQSVDLSSLPPGLHILAVTATDSTQLPTYIARPIVVTSSPSLTYPGLFQMGRYGKLLAVEGDRVAYQAVELKKELGSARLRDVVSASDVELATSSGYDYYSAQINRGRVYATMSYVAPGCDSGPYYCTFEWEPDGQVRNLTLANPIPASGDRTFLARGSFVIWPSSQSGESTGFTLYDINRRNYAQIQASPPYKRSGSNVNFDFALRGNELDLFYIGSTDDVSLDLYKWSSDTRQTARLTGGGAKHSSPQTDGRRVAWLQRPIGDDSGQPAALLARAVAGGAVDTLSRNVTSVVYLKDDVDLHDGVLSWRETTATGVAVKASTAAGISAITTDTSAVLLGGGGGFVVYSQGGKVYGWSAATQRSTLRIDALPQLMFDRSSRESGGPSSPSDYVLQAGQILISANVVYFTMGLSVYRIVLVD